MMMGGKKLRKLQADKYDFIKLNISLSPCAITYDVQLEPIYINMYQMQHSNAILIWCMQHCNNVWHYNTCIRIIANSNFFINHNFSRKTQISSRISNLNWQIANCNLKITNRSSQIAVCKFQFTNRSLQIAIRNLICKS